MKTLTRLWKAIMAWFGRAVEKSIDAQTELDILTNDLSTAREKASAGYRQAFAAKAKIQSSLNSATRSFEIYRDKAKTAKESGNLEDAKVNAEVAVNHKRNMEQLTSDLGVAQAKLVELEKTITNIDSRLTGIKAQSNVVEARQAANDARQTLASIQLDLSSLGDVDRVMSKVNDKLTEGEAYADADEALTRILTRGEAQTTEAEVDSLLGQL